MTEQFPVDRIHVMTVDSTNDEAKRELARGTFVRPTVIIAQEQTDGRGTRGRQWDSPARSGLYMTWAEPTPMIDDQPVPARDATLYTLASGIACAQACREVAGIDVRLKPINDLMVDGRKLGGILCESLVRGDHVVGLIIGIGINITRGIRLVRPDAPSSIAWEEVRPPGVAVDPAEVESLTDAIIKGLQRELPIAHRGDRSDIERRWRDWAISG